MFKESAFIRVFEVSINKLIIINRIRFIHINLLKQWHYLLINRVDFFLGKHFRVRREASPSLLEVDRSPLLLDHGHVHLPELLPRQHVVLVLVEHLERGPELLVHGAPVRDPHQPHVLAQLDGPVLVLVERDEYLAGEVVVDCPVKDLDEPLERDLPFLPGVVLE